MLAAELSTRVGVSGDDAAIFSEALVDADLHGVGTHGISRLNIYLQRIRTGLIDPKASLNTERKFGSILTLDAGNGLGQVQAVKALEMLVPLAKQNGIAAATVRNSQHFGALSYYCNLAAQQGLVLLAMTNCERAMSPEGGYESFFGTNPIAVSFPTGNGFSVKIDLATSIVARGNIISAQKKGERIPLGWALDITGEATTDPQEALLGTVLTMAGHKGYALALMVELFSGGSFGILLSGRMSVPCTKTLIANRTLATSSACSISKPFWICLNLSNGSTRLSIALKPIKRRPGVEEILVPGERSSRMARLNASRGIVISDPTLDELQHWCNELDVPFLCSEVSRLRCVTS